MMDFLPQFQARPALAITDLPHESNWMFFFWMESVRRRARNMQPLQKTTTTTYNTSPVSSSILFIIIIIIFVSFQKKKKKRGEVDERRPDVSTLTQCIVYSWSQRPYPTAAFLDSTSAWQFLGVVRTSPPPPRGWEAIESPSKTSNFPRLLSFFLFSRSCSSDLNFFF